MLYTQDVCYDSETGEEIRLEQHVSRLSNVHLTELDYSDMIINGDLLRFKEEQEQTTRR